jgi:hypothetical protein
VLAAGSGDAVPAAIAPRQRGARDPHEHRVRDLSTAKSFALQSLEIVEDGDEAAVRHRLARLEGS